MKTYHITPVVLQGQRCEVRRLLRGKEVWEPGYCHRVRAWLRTNQFDWLDEVGMEYGIRLDRETGGKRSEHVYVDVKIESNIRPEGSTL